MDIAGSKHKRLLSVSRITSLIASAGVLSPAWNSDASVYELVNYAWSGLGSTFGPLVIGSLYWKNISKNAALAGLIAGGLTSALWPFYFASLPLVPGFFAGFLVIYIGTVILK